MDSEKVGSSSESSSEEQSDPSDQVKEDYSDFSLTNKRSYGCIFCKRGFTNAQALGGHMNIHRKDRANKAKQTTSFASSSSSLPSKQIDQSTFINIPYFGADLLLRPQVNYQAASASNPHGYFQEFGDLNMNHELWGSDLSLQIEPNKARKGVWNYGDGLDLELRLGHDP